MIDLAASLASAIAWCDAHANPKNPRDSLRSRELLPWFLARDRRWIIEDVVLRRDGARRGPGALGAGGRLLVYFPDCNLSDGAAEGASNGYFDVENTPPWDTWVALFEDPKLGVDCAVHLLAWVPQPFVELADRGIRVNPEGCILWLDDAELANRAELLALRPAWR